MKSTHPITYEYEFDGHVITVTRCHTGTAYARNGNVGNPTEYFKWESRLDGEFVTLAWEGRAVAYEHARAKALGIPYRYDERGGRSRNVRPWTVVRDEMNANYRRRINQTEGST